MPCRARVGSTRPSRAQDAAYIQANQAFDTLGMVAPDRLCENARLEMHELSQSAPHLIELARHMTWADAEVWKAVLASPRAASDARIGDTLHHIHLVQHIFHQAWTGAPFAVRERKEFATPGDLAAWGQDANSAIGTFLHGARPEDLDRTFRMPWAIHFEERSKQTAGAHTLAESVLQVMLHTQHHRGQVCMRLRDVGVEPPTVDFILWLWTGRPAAEWAPSFVN